MGREIEALAKEKGHEICGIIRSNQQIESLAGRDIDVAIEFTQPQAVQANLKKLAELKIPTVCGTTGWDDQTKTVIATFQNSRTSLFYSSNFSIGVYLTFQIIKSLSSRLEQFKEYQPSIAEWHHTQKRDMPSGTAMRIADILLEQFPDFHQLAMPNVKPAKGEIGIDAFREGAIVGTHEARFTSAMDEIIIKHTAFDRKVFAVGALRAAEFLFQSSPGIYTMDDLINTKP